MKNLEPVFIAANDHEAEFVERLLGEQGIEYDVRPEVVMRETSSACYQGLLYEVTAGKASDVRKLLEKIGMKAGVIDAP